MSAPNEVEVAKAKVLAIYPLSAAWRPQDTPANKWLIVTARHGKPVYLGQGDTEDAAWLDAASHLPRVCPNGCDFGEGDPAAECFNCGNTNPNHNRLPAQEEPATEIEVFCVHCGTKITGIGYACCSGATFETRQPVASHEPIAKPPEDLSRVSRDGGVEETFDPRLHQA